MFGLIALVAATAAAIFGYTQSRRFVRNRLRFVDKVHGSGVPVVAGFAALIAGMIVTAVVPIVGFGTALAFGVSVGTGVAAGRSDIRHNRLSSGR